MRRLTIFLLLSVFLLCIWRDAGAAIALVANTTAGSVNTNNVTTAGINTTGASLIVISVSYYFGTSNINTPTDSLGNVYTPLTDRRATTNVGVRLFYKISPTVGAGHTFTVTSVTVQTYPVITVTAWSGTAASPFDLENGAGSAGVVMTFQPGSVTPSQANSLVITADTFDAANTDSVPGYTISNQTNFNAGNSMGGGMAYLIQGAAAATNPTWTHGTGTANTAAAIAVFKPAASATLSASPTSIVVNTTGNVITLTGTGTSWTAGTPGTPTFTLTGGTGASITAQSVSSGTVATITVSAGSAVGTNNLTITDPSTGVTTTISVTAAPPITTPVTNTKLFFAPYVWRSVGGTGTMQSNNILPTGTTGAATANCGAYLKLNVTVAASGYIKLNLDTTRLQSLSAGVCPVLAWSVDGGAASTQQLPYSASTYQLSLSTATGTHAIVVWVDAVDLTAAGSMGDRWNNGATSASDIRITGVETDASSSLNTPTVLSNNLLVYSDSTGEMAQLLSSSLTVSGQSVSQSWAWALAQSLQAEVGIVAWSGQGWLTNVGSGGNAYGNVPKLVDTVTPANSTWRNYSSGNSRLFGGLLVPAPNYIVLNLGQNDGATDPSAGVSAGFAAIRTAAGSSCLLVDVIPFSGNQKTNITSAWNTAAAGDAKTLLVDLGTDFSNGTASGGLYTNASSHLNLRGNAIAAARIAQAVQSKLAGGGTKRKVQ